VYAKDMEGAMAVAAVDFNLARSFYSNVNDYVEIAAPGGDNNEDLNSDEFADGILQQTLDPDAVSAGVFNQFGYLFEQGTSMATAHVSGLAALLVDQGITTPQAVEAAIKAFATDAGAPGRDDETGHGVINPRGTLRGLGLRR
jgi:serine protease